MKNLKTLLPVEFLTECFNYNPATGDLIWKERPLSHFHSLCYMQSFNTLRSNRIAGDKFYRKNKKPAAIRVGITRKGQSKRMYAHLVIASISGIVIPDGCEIDHVDGNPFNNKLTNLRVATLAENRANVKRHSDKKDGLPKGVRKRGAWFLARIYHNHETFDLGKFSTPDLASLAYLTKAKKLFGTFARIG